MALTKIKADGLTADLIDETKLADNSIDSEHYNDGSIDNAHLADDAVGIAELSATGTASSSTFLRGDNSWATPTDTNTVTTINNNADNRIITGSGTANTLNGESKLTFDGNSNLTLDAIVTVDRVINATDSADPWLKGVNSSNTETAYIKPDGQAYLAGNVNIGITSQLDSNKVNILGTKAYSAGIPQQQLNVADAQAYNTTDNGGSIGFSAKFNSGGSYTTMASIEGVKHNNIDGNYQGAITFKTRNHNGDNVIRMRLTDNGLCFGSDTAGANALDDFEEGNYSPTFGGATSTTNAYFYSSEAKLSYHKIGKLVVIHGRVRIEANNFAGQGRISLPFAAASHDSTDNAGCSAVATHGANFENDGIGVGHNMGLFIETGGSQSWAYFLINRDDSNWIGATSSHLKAGAYLAFNLSYKAT